jgi:hypothetical protein
MNSVFQSASNFLMKLVLLSLTFVWLPSAAHASNEMQISISGPDADGITNIGICFTNPAELGSSVSFSSNTLGSGGFMVHSGTPACPSVAAVSSGFRLTSGQTYTYEATATSGGRTYTASKTYTAPGEDPAVIAARQLRESQDTDFRNRQESARASAEAESKAWNAANPGKQKCIQWGPIVHANGVSTASGGVCANPVEPGPNTTVATQSAPSVSAPSETSSTTSQSAPSVSAPADSNSSNSSSSSPNSPSSSNTETSTVANNSTSAIPAPTIEFFPQWGSGTPYTRVLRGQLSTTECPTGFQGANGLIAAIGVGTFTECWPENAWIAYRLGGSVWDQFKSSGGSYNAKAELDRRNKVTELKSLAKSVAQTAADQTPGIQRCSKWTGYGESGEECAYTFVNPSGISGTTTTSPTSGNQSTPTSTDTRTVTSSIPSQPTQSSSVQIDPFPNLKNGEEIPNTRISSLAGMRQADWEQSQVYKTHSCPSGSGKATGVDLNFTVSQNDDIWYAYCVKVIQSTSSSAAGLNSGLLNSESSTTIASGKVDTTTPTTSTATSPSSSLPSPSTNSDSATATSNNVVPTGGVTQSTNTPIDSNALPTLQSSAIQVNGSVSELKALVGKVVEDRREAKAISTLINRLDSVMSRTSVKQIKLPGSSQVNESAESKTPEICSVKGVVVSSISKGICIVVYTVTDSDGNKFTTEKEIFFRK